MRKDIKQKVKGSTAFLATCKNPKYRITSNQYGKLENWELNRTRITKDITGKLHKNLKRKFPENNDNRRFSKWPTAKTCKTSETKDVINVSKKIVFQYGIPERIQYDRGRMFISTESAEFCKSLIKKSILPIRNAQHQPIC